MVVRLSALLTGRLYPQGIHLVLFSDKSICILINYTIECEHECTYVNFLSEFLEVKDVSTNYERFTSADLGEYLFAGSIFAKCQKRNSNRDINVAMWRVSKEKFLQISWEILRSCDRAS